MSFKRATRKQALLRLMWVTPSGRGKSYGGLWLISQLAKRVAGIDSERGSLSLYALPEGKAPSTPAEIAEGNGLFDFDVTELQDKTLQEYIEKIQEAASEGYDGLLIDSASHAWMSAQAAVDQMGGWIKGGKHISPLMAKLQDMIMSYPGHVVVTYRSKVKCVIEQDERGRTTIRKVGLEPVARGETEYDFTLSFESDENGHITVGKTRCSRLPLGYTFPRTDIPVIADALKAWLSEGAPQSPREVLADQMRFAKDEAALQKVLPSVAEHVNAHPEDREHLLGIYKGRKAEFQGVAA
jgi:AAA domain-containing protein